MAGDDHLECMTLKTPRGEEQRPASSLFIFIGAAPKTDWLPEGLALRRARASCSLARI